MFILGECAGIVLSLLEKLCGLEMCVGVGRQGSGEGDQFRVGLGTGVPLEQKLDEFDSGPVPVAVRIRVPHSVHGVVVITRSLFDVPAMGCDAGKSQIDGGVLRRALPESEEVRFGLVESARIIAVAQGAGEAELVLGVGGVASKSGAEGRDGVFVAAGLDITLTLRV